MIVISMEHSPENIKGWLCRYLYQLRPGLYVGTVNAKIRGLLWEKISLSECEDAVLIWTDNNEQGFSYLIKGNPRRKLKKIEGIQWICIERELDHLLFKAKTDTQKQLICHLLETGTVAKLLLTQGMLVPLTDRLSFFLHENKETTVQFISFLAALHDIGKIHPHFQHEIDNENLFQICECFDIFKSNVYKDLSFRHEQYSKEIVEEIDAQALNKISEKTRELMGSIIALHHQGHKTGDYYLPEGKDLDFCMKVQEEVIQILYDAFPFQLTSNKKWLYTNATASVITAIINLCDWISSTHGTFDEKRYRMGTEYLLDLEDQAYQFLKRNFMIYQPNSERFKTAQKAEDFFRVMNVESPRPMQETIIDICRKCDKGSLMVIEAPCGEGKTTGALYAASHLHPQANGFYMAMPTSATSESIHEEINLLCKCAEIKLPVFNGRAWMSDKDISLDKDLWVSPSRQKLFYPIAVGTIDQMLKSSLMIRYGLLRLLALMNKTVIIDEMHAYDVYMRDTLKIFLAYCGIFQVPVVILSATLPTSTKEELLTAYTGFSQDHEYVINGSKKAFEGHWQLQDNYPLITTITNVEYMKNADMHEETFSVNKCQTYKYQLLKLKNGEELEEICHICIGKISNGGCLALIVNTVDEAKNAYRYLKKVIDSDTELYLLHGRNTEANKEEVSDKIKTLFGKDRSHRPVKSIIVSTQILEQSMDIDLDFMCTMLAPIDLLVQRFGRYRRHYDHGTIRERINTTNDKIFIFVPQGKVSKRHSMIYKEDLLRLTESTLMDRKESILKLPYDTRHLIESVYGKEKSSIKDIKKHLAAEKRLLSDPKSALFKYYEEMEYLQSEVDTRYSDVRTYDIAVLPDSLIEQLREKVDSDTIKHVYKNYVVRSIPEYLLQKNEKVIACEIDVEKIKQLKKLKVFVESEGIYIDKVYGLELREDNNVFL